ncbi:MAG TPA: 16S rRNA (guanine(527)-N(7))-methyltransferase RsmG [Bryobacteraceae bacterium]|jgi:16S rRNA (guanine527-N7)-methyltransferase|nr:16S rRNA (guanine(527)-N(7))-methyltransferase RsmG [Bryobacteraceae bacterium]
MRPRSLRVSKPSAEFSRLLDPVLHALQIDLNDRQRKLLEHHFGLLLRWNQKINLTSLRDPEEIVTRHFGESLFLASALPSGCGSLIDVGSGAGFPGIPIAVYHPDWQVTLAESVGKRAVFLKEATRYLANVSVWHGRFEDMKGCFEWAAVRALRLMELERALKQRAAKIAVLVSNRQIQELSTIRDITWSAPLLMPWDPGRALVLGSF